MAVQSLKQEMKNYADEKHKITIRLIRQEIPEKVEKEFILKTNVPGIIGPESSKCRFPDFKSYVKNFEAAT